MYSYSRIQKVTDRIDALVRKYRPSSFVDTVLEPYNRKIFHNILEHKRFPHLLLYGPPGPGRPHRRRI